MAIKFEVLSIENAQDTGVARPYVQLVNGSRLSEEELEERIEKSCSVTRADVKAVLSELCHYAIEELSAGNRFYIPNIGYLSLSVGNTPPAQKADGKITGKDVYLRNINFKPDRKFFGKVRSKVSFERSSHTTRSTRYTYDELWARVSSFLSENGYVTCRIMYERFGLGRYLSKQWLTRFTEDGKLEKQVIGRQQVYKLVH